MLLICKLCFHVLQVLCSALSVYEDMHIWSIFVGDIHRISNCVQLRLGEVVDSLIGFRRTQMNLVNRGLGLHEAMDDITPGLHVTHSLLGEFPPHVQSTPTTDRFVAEIQEATSLDGLDHIPLPS